MPSPSSTVTPLLVEDDDNDTNQNVTSITSSDNDTNQNVTSSLSLNNNHTGDNTVDDTYNEEDYRDISDEEEDFDDDDDDTMMGRSLSSDAAVALPKRNSSFKQSLRRTVEAPRRVARTLSYGSANLSFAGSASSAAAAAALATVAQSSDDDDINSSGHGDGDGDDDNNNNNDHPPDAAPTRKSGTTMTLAPAHVPHRGRTTCHQNGPRKTGVRRLAKRSLSGGSTKLRQAVAAAAASVTAASPQKQRSLRSKHPENAGERVPLTATAATPTAAAQEESDGDSDVDYDDGNASMMPVVKVKSTKKKAEAATAVGVATTTTAAVAVAGTTTVVQTAETSQKKSPSSTRSSTRNNQQPIASQTRSTSRRTLRTESANSTDEDDVELCLNLSLDRPFALQSGVTGRSKLMDSSSRHNNRGGDARSHRSNKTSRTLAEIRKEKVLQEQQEAAAAAAPGRPIWCCGLSKCGWSLMLLLAACGFGAGFLVPLLKNKPEDGGTSTSTSTSDGTSIKVATDPPHPGGHQVYNPPVEMDGEETNDTTPVFTPLNPGDEFTQDGATYGGTTVANTIPPQDPLPPPVDVWNLFQNKPLTDDSVVTTIPLPSELPELLARSNLAFSESHLQQAARHFVQKTIHANIRKPLLRILKTTPSESHLNSGNGIKLPKTEEVYEFHNDDYDNVIPFVDTPLAEYDSEMPYPQGPSSSSATQVPHGDIAQWESLMATAGVQRSDILQMDRVNHLLYVGHGQHVDVIDTIRGTLRTTLKLPTTADNNPLRDSWLVPPTTFDRPGENEWKPAPPAPFIEQLLLTSDGNHLIIIVSDYSSVHAATVKPLLKESRVTNIWTYHLTHETLADEDAVSTSYEIVGRSGDTADGAATPHVVHGRVIYAAQATANQHIHVVTSSSIESERLLQDPLERLYYPDHDRHDMAYADEIVETAHGKYIPLYTRHLLQEINGMGIRNYDADAFTLWPFTEWVDASTINSLANLTDHERQMQTLLVSQDHLQELVVVTSLSIVQAEDTITGATATEASRSSSLTGSSITAVSTAFLAPAAVDVIGSTDTQLTLSVPGYQWTTMVSRKVLQEATHIIQLELGTMRAPETSNFRAATRLLSTAAFPGRFVKSLARESTEMRGDDLRMATVVTKQWSLETSDEGEAIIRQTSLQEAYIHVVGVDNLQHRRGSPLSLYASEGASIAAVSFLESFAYVFPAQRSSPAASKLKIQVVDLGSSSIVTEGGEKFSLRIHIAGSIDADTEGLSPYLHELDLSGGNDNAKYMVSIGENKIEGNRMGLMISVWEANGPAQLTPSVQYSLETSDVLTTWEPRTFRMTPRGQMVLPVTKQSVGGAASPQTNMKGFLVLNISPTEISERAHLAHSPANGRNNCIPGDSDCSPPLAAISLLGSIKDGNYTLFTLEGNAARSTIFEDQEHTEAWTLALH